MTLPSLITPTSKSVANADALSFAQLKISIKSSVVPSKVDNNYHFKEKWSNYFQFKDFEKIGLKIIKKSISKLKYNKNKGITSEEIFNKAIKILKINNDKYPLTKRRVELSMVKIGLKSKVFNLNGKRLRRWFLK